MATNGQLYFQLQEPSRNDEVSVGITSSTISEARNQDNPRKVIIIRNTSPAEADIITVNFGQNNAVANKGIVLKQGEAVTDAQDMGYNAFQGVITAICVTANGVLSIMER